MKKRLPGILCALVFLAGLAIFAYPKVADQWNTLHQSRAISTYDDAVQELDEEDYSRIWEEARAYNAKITENTFHGDAFGTVDDGDSQTGNTNEPETSGDGREGEIRLEDTEYWKVVNVDGTGIMGYISIPKINQRFPIYHGTSEGVLQIAAGASTSYSRGTAEKLEPGLYLVKAEKVQHDGYEYSFSPYLISVPTSEYRMGEGKGDDEWLYDVTVGLKPSREPLEGDMKIRKTLNTYNESLGEVTFVFEVTGKDPVTGEVVYNNVVSMNFDDGTPTGTQTVKITGLPVGTVVTVKEIYNGGSYKEVSADYTTTIEPTKDGVSQTKPVTFVNDYDDKLKKGCGIVNHFDFVGDEAHTDEDGNLVVKGHYEWEKWFPDFVEAESESGPTGKGTVPEEEEQGAQ